MKDRMMPRLENLLSIDWELGKQLAGNKIDLAQDLLNLLIKTLPSDLFHIKSLYVAQDYQQLLKQVHKLHGALSYCGVPRLKTVIAYLETNLKNNIMVDLPFLFDQLDIEVNNLLQHYHQPSLLND